MIATVVAHGALRARRAGAYLDKPRFSLVSYGCSMCTGNSGPLPPVISAGGQRERPVLVSVLRSLREPAG
jgi:aconitate hydratase